MRATRSEPDTPCVGAAKCSAGNREGRDAARARGSSLRNCTFWKEPSNHEFRVFVDEYLISNFMMSFLPPIPLPSASSNLVRPSIIPLNLEFESCLQGCKSSELVEFEANECLMAPKVFFLLTKSWC